MKKHLRHIFLPTIAILLLIYCDKQEPIKQATLSTLSVSNITNYSAQSGGNITSDGGDEISSRGVVWYISSNPTVEQNDGITLDGTRPGLFQSNITGLQPNTKYYVRAYATNSAGTAYGSQIDFTTTEGHSPGNETQVVEVLNPITGRIWMDRNLGASQAATSSFDAAAYGHIYQWGRATDGHQFRSSGATSGLSHSDTAGCSFITVDRSPHDWRSPQNHNLWQGVNGTNNPCPAGFRLPTGAELNAERLSWSSDNAAGAFASPLKLPMAGARLHINGTFGKEGSEGHYWSSTVDGTESQQLDFSNSGVGIYKRSRAFGSSVRCIKD